MNQRTARAVLRCAGPHELDSPNRTVRDALKVTEKSPEVVEALATQREADAAAAEKLMVDLPPEFLESMDHLLTRLNEPTRKSNFSVKEPAFLALALAFMAMVGLGAWMLLAQLDGFSGMEEAVELAKQGDLSQPSQFEPLDANAGALGDWFVMQGFDGFQVPQEFSGFSVVGVRVFDFEGTQVALSAVPENRSFFYVFPSKQLGISPGESGSWRVLEYGEGNSARVLGISQIGDVCFMVTFAGERSDMENFLRDARAQ